MSEFVELRKIILIVARRWKQVAIAALLICALGFFISERQERVFTATTSLIVGQTIENSNVNRSDVQLSQQLVQTYANIVQRQPVLQGAVDKLKLSDTWRNLARRVQVRQVADTQLLEITVEARSPREAQLTADEIARQLILLSPTTGQNQQDRAKQIFVQQRLALLQRQIGDAQARIDELNATSLAETSTDVLRQNQAEINTLGGFIIDWENNYAQLLISFQPQKSANHLAVIEAAQPTLDPVRPRVLFNTVLAFCVGLLLGLITVFTLEFMDDTLKPSHNLTQLLGLPMLGSVSQMRGHEAGDKLIINMDLYAQASEDYRLLRSKIQYQLTNGVRSIMVTSAGPHEGRSLSVANLGLALAQAGVPTIIVDADFRHPVQHELFGLSNDGGLGKLLRYPRHTLNDHLHAPLQTPNLQVLNSGSLPPDAPKLIADGSPPGPAELLSTQRMREVLNELLTLAEIVLIDCPPAVGIADALVLAQRVDGVIFVAEANRTTSDAARQAITNLQQVQTALLGIVLNRVPNQTKRERQKVTIDLEPTPVAEPSTAQASA